jgi:hypothetical protein
MARQEVILEIIYLALICPLLLVGVAWARPNRLKASFTILTLSALLVFFGTIRPVKWVLWGPDYSHRLYTEIFLNLLVAVLLAVYFAIRRRWIAAFAGFWLSLLWLYAGAVNSVV